MRYYELTDQHPAMRIRPGDIARLYVHETEWSDLQALCASHEPCSIIGIEPSVMIPTCFVEVLCQDPDTAFDLALAWYDFCQTSPYRPHSAEEASAWGRHFNAHPDIPSDWTF